MVNIYEILAAGEAFTEPAKSRGASLGEVDYRPGHGQPGGAAAPPHPEVEADPDRFTYPTPPVVRPRAARQTFTHVNGRMVPDDGAP